MNKRHVEQLRESNGTQTDILDGIRFHRKADRETLTGRINSAIATACTNGERTAAARFELSIRFYRDEIASLKNALELEQARHRADIFNFAAGRNHTISDILGKAGA